jgi:hypothetical protein
VAYVPQVCSGYFSQSSLLLRLPLNLYNTGARSIVVTDFRVIFAEARVAAPVSTFRDSVKPEPDDVSDFAHPFPVPGRQAVSRFVEFSHRSWTPALNATTTVQVRKGGDERWFDLVTFELTTLPREKASAYIAHRRDPADERPALEG